jgi:hypothetical protein
LPGQIGKTSCHAFLRGHTKDRGRHSSEPCSLSSEQPMTVCSQQCLGQGCSRDPVFSCLTESRQ